MAQPPEAPEENLGEEIITAKQDVEFKPMAFYYEIDPYLPIKVLLEGSGFILDNNLGKQIEKAVGRSTFSADPNILRMPVVVSDVYDLDKENIELDVARYQQKRIDSWEVQILDMAGMNFRTITGDGSLPELVTWDGRSENGEVLSVGDVYTFNVRLTTKEEATIRKGGGTIDVNGVAYENVVSIKESEMDVENVYGTQVSRKVADYYQMVMNRFKEGGYTRVTITASDRMFAEAAKDYLSERLINTPIDVQEDPQYPRVQFVFN
ncbi:hypothetical protein GF359_08865 [candidate division WOR-3 bacterium]|uniref:Uncharacterized protein n=1 Tax=candidate division WOR-3 bacterium TaxID=2052148 RepID=A0A9D5KAC1_UNCW3|nr:hypothetical protein [candidate division WOR-3 bacterium]MBD3365311.1 hypothetical protein [candidate division WOR-3 bacterium]